MSCLHRGDMTSFIPKTTYRPSSLRATHFFLHYLLPPPHQHSSSFQSMLASFFLQKSPLEWHNIYVFSKWIFGPKTGKFGLNWHFRPNISIFGPFDLMPDQKTIQTSCPGGFSVIWVPKLLLTPIKIRLFGL